MEVQGTREFFVHEVDYEVRDDSPVVRIFGRDAAGSSVAALSKEFKPYFYCMPEAGSNPRELMRRILAPEIARPAHVIDARVEILNWRGEGREIVKVIIDSPRNVRSSRSFLGKIPAVAETLEKDILFKRRFMIDTGTNPLGLLRVVGSSMDTTWPIDALVEDATNLEAVEDRFLRLDEMKVLAFDLEVSSPAAPSPQVDPIIMIGMADAGGMSILTYDRDGEGMETCRDEKEMISRFISRVQDEDYDVLVGYNSDSFDLPYLRTRARRNGLRLRLGRDLSEVSYQPGVVTGRSIVRGRINIDLYPPARRMMNLPAYTLASVYHQLSGNEKIELSMEEIHRLWEGGSQEGAERVAQYCASDVEATLYIAGEILPTLIELSKQSKQLLADVARMGQSQLVEWLLIREAFLRGELVPNKPGSAEFSSRRRETYEGGYVLEPRKGLQTNIVSLDFRSLYPTIIVTHNVDISTLDCDCCEGENLSPTGHHFCTKKEGFIPSILCRLVERRFEIRSQMEGLEPSDPESGRLDAMQNALKILSNSFYGYSGYPQARWYSKECAESVASWGREYIMKTIESAEKEGFQVVYSDTDSIFITMQGAEPHDLIAHAKSFLERVNSSLPGIIQLEYQSYDPRGLFVSKKRYALIDEDGKITTRGLEAVRRDWSPIAKETQRRVLRAILEEADPSRAADEVRESIRRVSERLVGIDELVISTRMTKTLQSYDADAPHVALAKRLKDRGEEVRQGSSIDYVVRKGTGKVGDRAQLAREAQIQEYDVEYYVGSQILPPSMRILSAFGYREEDLRYYKTRQKTLDLF